MSSLVTGNYYIDYKLASLLVIAWGLVQKCRKLSIPSHGSMGYPPVPLTDACVSYCPFHPTVPWDYMGWTPDPLTYTCMSNCPSHGSVKLWVFINFCIINIFETLSSIALSCILNLAWPLLHSAQSAYQRVLSRLQRSADLALIVPRTCALTWLCVHSDDTFMGLWDRMNSGSVYKRDRLSSHGVSHCPMGLWDGMDYFLDYGISWQFFSTGDKC